MADKSTIQAQPVVEANDPQGSAIFQDTMDRFFSTAEVEAVYGAPVQIGNQVIIPTAEVMCAMGFGYGSGNWSANSDEHGGTPAATGKAEESSPPGNGVGSGGGGGGYTFSRPVALVIASPEGVRVEPIIDRTKIWLAAFTAAGFMISMSIRMLKR